MEVQTPPSGDSSATVELRYWETPEYREKYSDADRDKMAKSGHAMPDGSYPIEDAEDLDNAIHAVGRGGSDHDAIRKHIISRAHAMGHSDAIPDNWNADGSLKQDNSSEPTGQERRATRGKDRTRVVPLGREVRFYNTANLEVRREQRDNTDDIIITGAAIQYGVPYSVYDIFGEFRETIHHGAVAQLLPGADVRFLLNHDGLALARTASGTLTLRDTPAALLIEARLDARQQLANDFAIAVERGDMSQMSVGMIVGRDQWGWDDEAGIETRDVYALHELLDVSGVTYPASPSTHLEVAQRMAFAMPLETRARLRQMEVELRAGKVLSAESQAKLVTALSALHDLAGAGGIDIANALGASGPEGEEDDDEVQSHADGSDDAGGNIESDAGITFPDGSGARESEEEVEVRTGMSASTLRLLVEAGRAPRRD